MISPDTIPTERWALVTGASGGLGREFAVQLAARGYHLVLVARSTERLEALRTELATNERQVRVVTLDLARPAAAEELVALTDREGIVPAVVVNNAGIGTWERVLDGTPEKISGLLTLNVHTLLILSQLYGARMRQRRGGYLLQVASTAAFQPIPSLAVYAATKAMVLSFSRALHHEGRKAGVSSTTLCPGPTATGFFDRAGFKPNPAFRTLMMPAAEVARQGLEAMFRRKEVHVPGWMNRLITLVPRLVPSSLMVRIAARFSRSGGPAASAGPGA